MKLGLEEDVVERIQRVFENNSKIDEVLLFGSRAKGNYRENSDIDLAIKGRKLSFEDVASVGAKLDELNLPFEIDLLDYETISEPALVEHIDRVGVVFWARWRVSKLKDIGASLISGFAFKSKDFSKNGIPLIKIGNIQDKHVRVNPRGDFVSHSISKNLSKFLLSDKDVLIAMTGQGSVGRVGRLKLSNGEKAFLNQRVGKFVCDEKSLNIDYLYYVLSSEKYQDSLFNAGSGSGQPNLSPELILATEIPYVNYEVQKRIGLTLSSLDDKIDLLQSQNNTLEELAETAFNLVYEEVNDEWEDGYVGDLLKLQRGFDLPRQNRIEGKYPVITASGFNGLHNVYKVKGPGVTTGRSGLLGEVFYIDEDFWPLNTSLFITDFKRVSPLFAYFFLKKLDLASLNGGSAVPTLNRNDVHSIPTKIPPVGTVERFDKMVKPMYDKKRINQTQITSLTKLRDSLFSKLISGGVRVNLE